MTLRISREAGKGSARRATQDDESYRNNYDAIFGKKKIAVPFIPTLPDTAKQAIDQYQKDTENANPSE